MAIGQNLVEFADDAPPELRAAVVARIPTAARMASIREDEDHRLRMRTMARQHQQ